MEVEDVGILIEIMVVDTHYCNHYIRKVTLKTQKVRNRRKWFLTFAKAKGFHPFVPENWYSMDIEKVIAYKV